ncbi:hypothetical protein OH799_08725 [Nocardia sp. NBC_00881]|uniref:hypothetical protein n=1 Tax=Nocardia sp. NBC_00881 TaxID=2975995 RepID=UPI003866C02C|nr:hypothetical protein OH799_08725 [Nocardia sp. NBC_00881]
MTVVIVVAVVCALAPTALWWVKAMRMQRRGHLRLQVSRTAVDRTGRYRLAGPARATGDLSPGV